MTSATQDEAPFPTVTSSCAQVNLSNVTSFPIDELSDKSCCKIDLKNSRRKTDKPRKRKRDSKEKQQQQHNSDVTEKLDQDEPMSDKQRKGCEVRADQTMEEGRSDQNQFCAPSVEKNLELPVTRQVTSDTTDCRNDDADAMQTCALNATSASCNAASTVVDSSNMTSSCTSSVRHLEEVMNKHLPSPLSGATHAQSQAGLSKRLSPQWGGVTGLGAGAAVAENDLIASNFLRSLYANRESVIKGSSGNMHCSSNVRGHFDNHNALLTPPDHSTEHAHLSRVNKTSVAQLNGLGYAHNPLFAAMTGADMSDSFAMTPPSSVSPQEKYMSQQHVNYFEQFHCLSENTASPSLKTPAYVTRTPAEYMQYYGPTHAINPFNHFS